MAEQTYALAKGGIFGLSGGVYQDALTKIIDGWEDNDIAEYGGETGYYSAQTSTVKDGSYALYYTDSSYRSIASTSGLNAYPSQGDTFRCWTQMDSNDSSFIGFSSQSETKYPDGYYVIVDVNNGELRFEVRSGGSNTTIASTAVSLSGSTWYETECTWKSDGTANITLYDSTGSSVASISGTDTTFSSGGIAFVGSSGGTGNCYWDNYRITG